jgi:hypothetical protein
MLTHMITNIQSRILLSVVVARRHQVQSLFCSVTDADLGQDMVARREERCLVI